MQLLDKVKNSLTVSIPTFASTLGHSKDTEDEVAQDTAEVSVGGDSASGSGSISGSVSEPLDTPALDENIQKILDSIEKSRTMKSFHAKSSWF